METVERLTIGQVAERTELSVHALRFYEREGLLANPVPETRGGDGLGLLEVGVLLDELGRNAVQAPVLETLAQAVRRGGPSVNPEGLAPRPPLNRRVLRESAATEAGTWCKTPQ